MFAKKLVLNSKKARDDITGHGPLLYNPTSLSKIVLTVDITRIPEAITGKTHYIHTYIIHTHT